MKNIDNSKVSCSFATVNKFMIVTMLVITVSIGYQNTMELALTSPIYAQVQQEQQQQSSSAPSSQQQEGQRLSTPSSSTSSSSGRVIDFDAESESDGVETLPTSTSSSLQGTDNNTSQENLITGSFG